MNALSFTVVGARPAPATASPAILFRLRIVQAAPARVHAIALRVQVQIEARRRRYAADERERLYELFGSPEQWDRTLHALTWAQASTVVPAFDDVIEIDLSVPCTYDLEVAAAKYFHGVRGSEVPLLFLFTGTVFTVRGGALEIEPVPWDREAAWRLPAQTWHETMHTFFPGGGWIRLRQDTIDRLQAFRGAHAVVTWDEAIDRLLPSSAEEPA